MFGRKKYKNISEYSANEWEISKSGTEEQVSTIFRINKGIKEAVGHPDYPIRMGVAIPLDSLKEQNPDMNAIEDMLSERLISTELGVQAMAISQLVDQEFKEFVFYTKTTVDFKKIHEDLQVAFPNYEIQFYAEKDPEWSLYASYIK